MEKDLIPTLIVLAFLVLAFLYVRSRINSIVDEQPDLGLAQAQNAPLMISPETAEEYAVEYQKREDGLAI